MGKEEVLDSFDLTKNEFTTVARLHKNGIKKGFLSSLSDNFLKQLYFAISTTKGSIVFVSKDPNTQKVIGFIAGALDTRGMYLSLLFFHGWKFLIHLFPYAFQIKIFKKILETLFYPILQKKHRSNKNGQMNSSRYCAELLSISVDENYQGRGIGKKLVNQLEIHFKNLGTHSYKVVTFSKDVNSNRFYLTCNFVLNRQFTHHGNLMNEYIKVIK
jgi:GNAT superfamily N-acetyltransferase